jgi:DNA-binding SARP family transcriptional activator
LASFLFTFPDRPHRCERLIDLFWPELDGERGRRAANSAIWRLRKLLASAAEYEEGVGLRTVGPETILERTSWLEVDTWALHEAARTALGATEAHLHPSGLKQILAVLYRYEGPFLDGKDAERILEERERLHSLFVQMAMTVVRHLGLCGLCITKPHPGVMPRGNRLSWQDDRAVLLRSGRPSGAIQVEGTA